MDLFPSENLIDPSTSTYHVRSTVVNEVESESLSHMLDQLAYWYWQTGKDGLKHPNETTSEGEE